MGQALNAHYTDGGASGAPLAGSLVAGLEDPRDPWTRSADGQGVYVTVVAHSRIIAPAATALRDELLEHMRLPQGYFPPRGHDRIDHGDGQGHDRPADHLVSGHERPDRGVVAELERPDPGEQDRGDDGWAATTAAMAARSRTEVEVGEQVDAPQRGIAGGANEASPAQAPEQDETLGEQFAALREQILSRNRKGLDARQAEFAAAHQLSRAHPHLTVAELRQALDQGGATGQGTAGLPADRAVYIARTAERVLAQPQRPPATGEARATGAGR